MFSVVLLFLSWLTLFILMSLLFMGLLQRNFVNITTRYPMHVFAGSIIFAGTIASPLFVLCVYVTKDLL